MSRTHIETQAAAIGALTEGMSLSAVSRTTGLSRSRLGRLVLQAGRACERLLDERIRSFRCEQIEADEQWMYVHKRKHNIKPGDLAEVGDAWVWTGLDPDSKLIAAHHVGKRQLGDAMAFAERLRRRIDGRPQFNTDRLNSYRSAIWGVFSTWDDAQNCWDRPDWGTVVKHFKNSEIRDIGRYVPPRMERAERRVESGNPDVERISTSHVESHHLQFRMRNKRAARMTNAQSRTFRHLRASVAMYVAHYDFVRRHSTIKTTPAVAAGMAEKQWTMGEFAEWVEMYGR